MTFPGTLHVKVAEPNECKLLVAVKIKFIKRKVATHHLIGENFVNQVVFIKLFHFNNFENLIILTILAFLFGCSCFSCHKICDAMLIDPSVITKYHNITVIISSAYFKSIHFKSSTDTCLDIEFSPVAAE
jgi:hypothetical protein